MNSNSLNTTQELVDRLKASSTFKICTFEEEPFAYVAIAQAFAGFNLACLVGASHLRWFLVLDELNSFAMYLQEKLARSSPPASTKFTVLDSKPALFAHLMALLISKAKTIAPLLDLPPAPFRGVVLYHNLALVVRIIASQSVVDMACNVKLSEAWAID